MTQHCYKISVAAFLLEINTYQNRRQNPRLTRIRINLNQHVCHYLPRCWPRSAILFHHGWPWWSHVITIGGHKHHIAPLAAMMPRWEQPLWNSWVLEPLQVDSRPSTRCHRLGVGIRIEVGWVLVLWGCTALLKEATISKMKELQKNKSLIFFP